MSENNGQHVREKIHGGDVYRNRVSMDFSINVNPLGIPESVKQALKRAVNDCGKYPDISAEQLKLSVGKMHGISPEYLLFGNGASELLMAVVHAVMPKKTVIVTPSFYGYEYAAGASQGEIVYYGAVEKEDFHIGEALYDSLTDDVDLLFLANPNNPTGNLIEKGQLRRILSHCKEKEIYVLLDECFIEFCGSQYSMISEVKEFNNLLLLRAFTKIFAIPGVRLGYLVCGEDMILERIAGHLPEWNVSCFAHAAGCACSQETTYIKETAEYVRIERRFLMEGLQNRGIRVFPSEVNFVLCRSRENLFEQLLLHGILIRDCENFRGLGRGFYRIAVKGQNENKALLNVLKK